MKCFQLTSNASPRYGKTRLEEVTRCDCLRFTGFGRMVECFSLVRCGVYITVVPTVYESSTYSTYRFFFSSFLYSLIMDEFSEFLSPEGLRLLGEASIDNEYDSQPYSISADQDRSTHPAQCEVQMDQSKTKASQCTTRCSKISLGQPVNTKRKRSKFDEQTRKKVATIRKKGACLRCRALKLPVGSACLL